jgi:8-oxo-dGTP pyrophosphatase MutT (NUDIX family)/GNAT superfamily N-acetyltransferase
MRAHEFTDQGAAGIVLYAEDTGRYGLQQRSETVNDAGLWAAWGGGREPGESLEQCARRELAEEGGYTGPIQLQRLGENSRYVTFLGRVPHEFEPRADSEWQDYCWVNAGNWPAPMHPGVAAALHNISVNESVPQPGASSGAPTQFVQENVVEGLENNRISFQVQKAKNKFATTLSIGNNPVGVYQYDADTGRSIAEVYPEFKGKGLGKLLVLHAIYTAAQLGLNFQEDESRTAEYDNVLDSLSSNGYIVDDDGYWYVTGEGEQYLQQSMKQGVAENFADGKNPGRKGLSKRVGVNTKASVSSLRKTAKNSSGEKQRMAHWLANMKAGRAKAKRK